MLDISSQIFYTKATNLMSGAGNALINIIYECCLIQLQRPRNQNKQIFEGFAARQETETRVREVSKCRVLLLPLRPSSPRRRTAGAIRLAAFAQGVPGSRPGFLLSKAGKARRAPGRGWRRAGQASQPASRRPLREPASPLQPRPPGGAGEGAGSCSPPSQPRLQLGVRVARARGGGLGEQPPALGSSL